MIERVIKIVTLFCIVATLSVKDSYAQNRAGRVVDINIYFPYDQSHIDVDYMSNHISLTLVDSLLSDPHYISTLRRIEITAQSSPEGAVDYNLQLSLRRKESLEEYFSTTYPQISSSLFSYKVLAENWDLFREHLVEDASLPSKSQLLSIVDSSRDPDTKEWLLKTFDGGEPWSYIKEHILPAQRFGASMLFIPLVEVAEIPEPQSSLLEPIAMTTDQTIVESQLPIIAEQSPSVETPSKSKPIFAIKSNLLLDLVTAVNLALEIPIGKRWSVVGEVVYPWWRSWPANFTMQTEAYHAEMKYWLGERDSKDRLTGWNVGLYGGLGRYDVQPFTSEGVQGKFSDFGALVGYAHPIGGAFHAEYSLGVGYIDTSYQEYKMVTNTDEFGDIKVIPYPWMQNRLKTILPTRVGVALVWVIGKK